MLMCLQAHKMKVMVFSRMSVPPQIQKVLDDVDKQLHGDGPVNNVLATIEQKTGVRRLHIVLGELLHVSLPSKGADEDYFS